MRIRHFGPRRFKAVRGALVTQGYARTTINDLMGEVKRAFRWAVENEFCPVEIWQALLAVRGLQKGKTKAREPKPILPVSPERVNAVLPQLNRQVRDMVRLQLLTGCRPTEICIIRPRDVETDGDVWLYRPESHKTEHHGRKRVIFIGPRGQEILRPWLDRAPDAYCFSPAEAVTEQKAAKRRKRKTKVQPSQVDRSKADPKRKPQERYTKDSYGRAVRRACELAFGMPNELWDVNRTVNQMKDAKEAERTATRKRLAKEAAAWRAEHCWSPNQLRHSRATVIRKTYGLEAAQIALGHASADVTQIYAERDLQRGKEIALEMG